MPHHFFIFVIFASSTLTSTMDFMMLLHQCPCTVPVDSGRQATTPHGCGAKTLLHLARIVFAGILFGPIMALNPLA